MAGVGTPCNEVKREALPSSASRYFVDVLRRSSAVWKIKLACCAMTPHARAIETNQNEPDKEKTNVRKSH